MTRLSAAVAAALLATACGSEDGPDVTKLDCAWLVDENNCWREALRPVEGCLPAEDGTLAEDGDSCTFDDGFEVAFDEPVTLPLPDEQRWNFTATRGGELCLHVQDDGESTELTTSSGTVRVGTRGTGFDASLEITCADGSVARGPALELFGCEGTSLMGMPGTGSSRTDRSFTFLITGAKSVEEEGGGSFLSVLPAFSCEAAPDEPQDPPADPEFT
jgi:hypothetical protein